MEYNLKCMKEVLNYVLEVQERDDSKKGFKGKSVNEIIKGYCEKSGESQEIVTDAVKRCLNEKFFITDNLDRFIYDISLSAKMWMDSVE